MSADWDVDFYRNDFESEEHWELRKNFMLAHKDRLPEDEVVCLAQVFTNIELLGCRYPEGTMVKVAELAKGLVESYREKKKYCLKRTFVAASDAASAKVKGPGRSSGGSGISISNCVKKRKFVDVLKGNDSKKYVKDMEAHESTGFSSGQSINRDSQQVVLNTDLEKSGSCPEKLSELRVLHNSCQKRLSGSFSRFVLFVCDEHPVNLLGRNASLNKCNISWNFDSSSGNSTLCSVYLNDSLVATGEGKTNKISREMAARNAIQKLQSCCYTVRIKAQFVSGTTVSLSTLGSSVTEEKISKDDIGAKIMKLMGWTGGGLGVKEQGIIEPVNLLSSKGRRGFDSLPGNSDDPVFRSRASTFIRNWIQSDTVGDLVFSSDFTIDQRKILHEVATGLSLKSKSYGKGNDRHLVVSKKLSPWQIVEDLVNAGGTTSKYELIIPSTS